MGTSSRWHQVPDLFDLSLDLLKNANHMQNLRIAHDFIQLFSVHLNYNVSLYSRLKLVVFEIHFKGYFVRDLSSCKWSKMVRWPRTMSSSEIEGNGFNASLYTPLCQNPLYTVDKVEARHMWQLWWRTYTQHMYNKEVFKYYCVTVFKGSDETTGPCDLPNLRHRVTSALELCELKLCVLLQL